jgi:outer membrane PBP1 activator LpoA protein
MIFALPLLGAIGSNLASAAMGEASRTQKASARADAGDAAAPPDFSATLLGVSGSATPSAAQPETPTARHVRTVLPF